MLLPLLPQTREFAGDMEFGCLILIEWEPHTEMQPVILMYVVVSLIESRGIQPGPSVHSLPGITMRGHSERVETALPCLDQHGIEAPERIIVVFGVGKHFIAEGPLFLRDRNSGLLIVEALRAGVSLQRRTAEGLEPCG